MTTERCCAECGEWFEPRVEYAKLCFSCWKRTPHAQRQRADTVAQLQRELAGGAAENRTLREQLAVVRRINMELRRQLADLREAAGGRSAPPVDPDLHAMLPRLLQLCHPDRHGNSTAANTATTWLLAQRRKLTETISN